MAKKRSSLSFYARCIVNSKRRAVLFVLWGSRYGRGTVVP